jgi:uncharacterized protein YjbI with pentapeptide repeats
MVHVRDTRDRLDAGNATLSGSKFDDVNVNFSNSSFENVNMSGVSIDNANLTGMTLRGVKVEELFACYEASKG